MADIETIENRKIVLTNRMAVVILLAFGSAVFSATKFYDQTQYQTLVAQQNADKIANVKETVDNVKIEHDDDIKTLMNFAQELVKQEVGGLRADWERKNAEIAIEQAKQDKMIDRFIVNSKK